MKIQRTTDVAMDKRFLKALNPEEPTPITELLEGTLKNIKQAIKSRIFKEYLRELMADSTDGCIPLIHFSPEDTRQPIVDLLINGDFDLTGIPNNLKHLEHPPVREALEQTAYLYGLLRYVVKHFHHPGIVPGDVQGEHTQNGKFTIYSVDKIHIGNLERPCRNIKEQIELLQFEVEVVQLECNSATTDQFPGISPTSNHMIIIDLDPGSFIQISKLFQSLTEEQRDKTFIAAPMGVDFYRRFPFPTTLLNRPNIHELLKKEYDQWVPSLMTLLGLEE